MRLPTAFLIGLIFGLGITVSGMANPAKVLNFFDIAGTWDPSLAFVMAAALAVTAAGYALVFRRGEPLLVGGFRLPTTTRLDARLIGGAAAFGVGWGIAGFCPGGALPVVLFGGTDVMVFTAALVAGILVARAFPRPAARAATA